MVQRFKKVVIIGCFFLGLAMVTNCGQPSPNKTVEGQIFRFEAPHMGTLFTIQVWVAEPTNISKLNEATDKVFGRVAQLNSIFSDYLVNSEVNQLRKTPVNQPFSVSRDLLDMLKQSEQLFRLSNGHFDVTIGPMVQLWRRSRKNTKLPTAEQIELTRSRTGFEKLTIDYQAGTVTKTVEGMVLDFGGIVKGYAADEALKILTEAGYPHSIVAASGDIAFGLPPTGKIGWRVGLDTFEMATASEVGFHISEAAVSTSGDTKRYLLIDGQRFSHIVDKETGLGLINRIAVSVVAGSALLSDSYATAISLMGPEKGLAWVEAQLDVECRIVWIDPADHSQLPQTLLSSGFPRGFIK